MGDSFQILQAWEGLVCKNEKWGFRGVSGVDKGILDSFLVFFFSVGIREGVFDCTSHFVGGEGVGRYGSWGVG